MKLQNKAGKTVTGYFAVQSISLMPSAHGDTAV